MTGPPTPGQEGPSYAPPPLPEGWIAQWDGMQRKYYFVQLSTGVSQWDTPTQAAPTGPTPQPTPQGVEHPYGTPGQQPRDLDVITNSDGSQSIRHPDGSVEPYSGDRSLGSFAMNQLMSSATGGSKNKSQSGLMGLANQFLGGGSSSQSHGNSGSSSSGLSGMASQFLGGSSNSSHGQGSGGSSGSSGIVGALAGSLLGGGGKKPETNYSGSTSGQQQQHQSGLMGSLGGFLGGHQQQGSSGTNYGYSQGQNQQGGYSGTAPPSTYTPSGSTQHQYGQSTPGQQQPTQHQYGQNQNQNHTPAQSYDPHNPSFGAPPNQYGATPTSPPYGSSNTQSNPSYGGSDSQSNPPYGTSNPPYGSSTAHQHNNPPYGGGPDNQHNNPPYGGASTQHNNPPYGGSSQYVPSNNKYNQNSQYPNSNQPPYASGGLQHQSSYGNPQDQQHPPPPPPGSSSGQQYPPPPNYSSGGGGPSNYSGNLSSPQHSHFQGAHNAEHSGGLYGNNNQDGPPGGTPMHSRPDNGPHQGGYNPSSYGQAPQAPRW